jgi:hypothetical protein
MSTDTSVNTTSSGTSIATQIAMLAVESEQADYEAEGAIRDAERASKREHDKEQVNTIREKADDLLADGIVSGSLLVGSSVAQVGAADAKYDADTANGQLKYGTIDSNTAPELAQTAASSTATSSYFTAASTFLQGASKTSDLAFNAVTTTKDADAAEEKNLAEDAQSRAEDANAAQRRGLSQLDDKLAIAEELVRSDAETMSMLIRPA